MIGLIKGILGVWTTAHVESMFHVHLRRFRQSRREIVSASGLLSSALAPGDGHRG